VSETIRLDKWLWYARMFKSRSLASKICQAGKVRINRTAVAKASATVRIGDVLTLPQGDRIRVLEIIELGSRRGPAEEARTLYNDLSPPVPTRKARGLAKGEVREKGAGRPTKADRRATDRLKGRS
jgi:ribosome-associated heat shock protein Hsp15